MVYAADTSLLNEKVRVMQPFEVVYAEESEGDVRTNVQRDDRQRSSISDPANVVGRNMVRDESTAVVTSNMVAEAISRNLDTAVHRVNQKIPGHAAIDLTVSPHACNDKSSTGSQEMYASNEYSGDVPLAPHREYEVSEYQCSDYDCSEYKSIYE